MSHVRRVSEDLGDDITHISVSLSVSLRTHAPGIPLRRLRFRACFCRYCFDEGAHKSTAHVATAWRRRRTCTPSPSSLSAPDSLPSSSATGVLHVGHDCQFLLTGSEQLLHATYTAVIRLSLSVHHHGMTHERAHALANTNSTNTLRVSRRPKSTCRHAAQRKSTQSLRSRTP